ncbi:MAG TPA: hypothetical protein VFH83_08740, partial [Spirochaetia bacterium]|nr:hypothetical protein [Spirochaetia bacterium]
IQEEHQSQGFVIRSLMSDGDYHEVQNDLSEMTVRYRVASPQRKTDYTAVRAGNLILIQGELAGRPLSRVLRIDARPWFETVEVSLSRLAVEGSSQPFVFWIVHPWEARAYLMQAKVEPQQLIAVADANELATPIRMSQAGFFAFLWSALYWYRWPDGLFVRYNGVRGLPGTPPTVVELIAEQNVPR